MKKTINCLLLFIFFQALLHADAVIEGTVPLPDVPPAAVMAKRYKLVSRGGVLRTTPPLGVIWIEGSFSEWPETPTMQLEQRDLVFEPALLAIQKGTTVEFPNNDEEYHNVFSYSKPMRFDLGRFMPDERPIPSRVFNTPGQVVLRCDIHDHMRAIILIIDSPYFVMTDPHGNFRLDGLPAGDYTLKAWVDSKTTLEMPITLTDGETSSVAFSK